MQEFLTQFYSYVQHNAPFLGVIVLYIIYINNKELPAALIQRMKSLVPARKVLSISDHINELRKAASLIRGDDAHKLINMLTNLEEAWPNEP